MISRFLCLLIIVLGCCMTGFAQDVRLQLYTDSALYTGKDHNAAKDAVVTVDSQTVSAKFTYYDSNGAKISSIKNAGAYTVLAEVTASEFRGDTATALYSVIPVPLTVKPDNMRVMPRTFVSSYTWQYAGLVNGETESNLIIVNNPVLTSDIPSNPPPLGKYTIRVSTPAVLSPYGNYVVNPSSDTATLTVEHFHEVVFKKFPNYIMQPTSKGGAVEVTISAGSVDDTKIPAGTTVNIQLAGPAQKYVKLSKKAFTFSNTSTDSIILTVTSLDTKPANGAIANLSLWVPPGGNVVAADAVNIPVLNGLPIPGSSKDSDIRFFSPNSKALLSEGAPIRLVGSILGKGERAEIVFKPDPGVYLYDRNGIPIPSPYLMIMDSDTSFILMKSAPILEGYKGTKSRKVKIASARLVGSGKKLPVGISTHTVQFSSDHPYFQEVPTSTVFTKPVFTPDSIVLMPILYAKTYSGKNIPELLSVWLDSKQSELYTLTTAYGAKISYASSQSFLYDYTHLKATQAELDQGFTDSFTFYLSETGGSMNTATMFVSFGMPTSRGTSFYVMKDSFNWETANLSAPGFERKPSVTGYYYKPFARLGKGSKVKQTRFGFKVDYDKLAPDSVTANFVRNIRIYNQKEINYYHSNKGGATFFLDFSQNNPSVQRTGVGVEINVTAHESGKKVSAWLGTVVLSAPVISNVSLAVDSSNPEKPAYCLVVKGKYFGIAPKLMAEYKTTSKKPSVKVKNFPVLKSPANPEKRKFVTTVDSNIKISVPTATEMKEMNQEECLVIVKLPAKFPKCAPGMLDLLLNSQSAIGGFRPLWPVVEQVWPDLFSN